MKPKSKGRILAILMSLIMVFAMMPMMSQTAYADDPPTSGTCGPNLQWSLSGRTLTITGTGAMDDYGTGNNSWMPWIDSFNIIYNVDLREGLTRIGDMAFYSAEKLTKVTIPSSVESIGEAAFSGSVIGEVNFAANSKLKTISKEAFELLPNVTKITIPEGVTSIGDRAFYGCPKLTEITIPASVTDIGVSVLESCDNLKTINYGGTLAQWRKLVGNKFYYTQGSIAVSGFPAIDLGNSLLEFNSNESKAMTVRVGGKAWRVIGYDGWGAVKYYYGTATLISKDNIQNIVFHPQATSTSNHYSGSNLRANINALTGPNGSFSDAEKAAIRTRTLEGGSGNQGTDTYDSNKIAGDSVENALLWPLSVAEANGMDEELRKASSGWWLRSPGNYDLYAAIVGDSGPVTERGSNVYDSNYGLRPAFNLNLESVLFTSAAAGGKSSGTVGAASLKKVSDTANGEVKLTLLDKDRKFAVARKTASGRPGDTLSFSYTNATVYDPVDAPNEYISAIITDNNGYPLYYGRLAKPEAASGKVNVKIPSDLENGTYTLKLFSEQYNGDNNTDLASAFSDVTLTVNSNATSVCEVTYEVENGTWSDGSETPITRNVTTGQSPTNIPTGMKAKEGYTGGSWDVDPSSVTIDEPTTFTYRFKENKYQIHTGNLTGGQFQNIYFGSYQQSSDGNGGYKTEPVKWRVLSGNDSSYFLLSDKNLDSGAYHNADTDITWKDSAIRTWLNNQFLSTAFSAGEKDQIRTTSVLNSEGNGVDSTPGGANTKDKIFLLSVNEARTPSYGFVEDPGDSDTRKAQGTDYTSGITAHWMLRSPGNVSNKVAYVGVNGGIQLGYMFVNNTNASVRPAMRLSKDNILLYSKADGGKGEDVGNINEVLENTNNNDWKLTLLDSARNFNIKLYDATGSKRLISWSDAKTGDNEYVSAVIKNNKGTVTHYGRLKKLSETTDETGRIEIDLSGIDMVGKTLYVFNEQYNGDKKTDYASSLKEVGTTPQVAKHTVTYAVENGALGQDDNETETVYAGDKPANVPSGMIPTDGYEGGAWYQGETKLDGTPADVEISGNVNFTYRFDAKQKHTVTYEVVNGTWADDTNGQKSEQVYAGDKPESVPTGMKPASGYEGGAWYQGETKLDGTPADVEISGNVNFTYRFDAKQKHTVTYEVVNGTWSDDTNGQKSEQVYEGDKPKNVPTGMKPAAGYEGGSWDINPTTVTITEPTTFTYTFAEHICDWEFTGFTWTGDEENGYTEVVANYECTKDSSHTTTVNAELSDTTTEPTCTEGGKTTYTATVPASVAPDGEARTESKEAELTEATGHTFDQEKAENEYLKTEADCTHPAEYYMSCSKCDVSSQGEGEKEATFEFGERLGHEYGEWTKLDDEQHQRICEHDNNHVEKANHTWDTGKVTNAATTTATGEKTYTCTVCKATKTEEIPKLIDPSTQVGEDGTPLGKGASFEAAEKAITTSTSEEGPKGSKFAPLMLKSTNQGKMNIKLSWKKPKNSAKFVIYGNMCNAGGKKYKMEKLATVTGKSYNVKKISGAKLKKGTYYKFMVVALDKNNKVVSTSKVVHVATKGGKVKNYTGITVKSKVIKNAKKMKVGKTLKLGAKTKGSKVKKHRALCYETSNAKVATVNAKGKITAKGKGTCAIYIYTQNGIVKTVKVTVK